MTAYLDTSVVIALLTNDTQTSRAETYLQANPAELVVSDLGAAEFASAMARRVCTGELGKSEARAAFILLDNWSIHAFRRVDTTTTDIKLAENFLRRLDLTLRTADAIHLAIAYRLGVALVTFDNKMATAAPALGIALAPA